MNPLPYYEKVVYSRPEHSLSAFTMNGSQQGVIIRSHWHAAIELIYIIKGTLHIRCGGADVTAGEGQLILINPDEIHSIENRGEHYRYFVIMFDMTSLLAKFGRSTHDMQFSLDMSHDDEVADAVLRIQLETEQQQHGFEHWILAMLHVIAAAGLRRHPRVDKRGGKEATYSSKQGGKIRSALEYIHEHFRESLTLEALAATAYMSTAHFCRSFKQITGCSPLHYVQLLRLDEAQQLLSQRELLVSEVAELVGYDDVNYFCRLYRRKFGVSPGAMRKPRIVE